jgi:hypothetical protein
VAGVVAGSAPVDVRANASRNFFEQIIFHGTSL